MFKLLLNKILAHPAWSGIGGLVAIIALVLSLRTTEPVTSDSETDDTTFTSMVSNAAVAIVYDPPSNVRETPNGTILCSVREKGPIEIFEEKNGWYQTNVCGTPGVIHKSQISFNDPSD